MIPETFFSVHEELILLGLSFLFGIALGICWDILRFLRLILPHNCIIVAAEDILFLGFYAVFLISFASAAARGELRFYYVIGNAAGFLLYFATVGNFMLRTLRKIISFTAKILSIIFCPLRSCYVLLSKKAAFKFVGCSKILSKCIKKTKMLLLKSPKMMYNNRTNNKGKNVKIVGEKVKKK